MSPTTDADATAWVLTLSCPDRPGIVAAVAGLLAEHGGNITESQQFGDADSGLFFMRVQVTAAASRESLETALAALAERFDLTWELDVAGRPVRTLVMVSTAAHCLNDLAFRQRSESLPIDIVAVVSNHEVLRPLAEFYDIAFHHLPVSPDTKAQAEARLLELVDQLDVELVVLARYMQVLSDDLCRRLPGRVINIHHSFLPSFKGARPYAQA
ncbi:MAG: formyltetrahydrofolate deformylase, partial [Cellulomonas sp.]|nr:formyltetrahydrofolate deformylase [Cellulomonas sp.]